MVEVAHTMEERLALIKKIAKRKNMLKTVKQKTRKARSVALKEKRDDDLKWARDDGNNINAWTDERKYAQQYYGDAYADTTRYDNDWD